MFRIPAFGSMMRMAGDIPVKCGERASAVKAMADARDRLKKRVSVMVFPEGTRSRDGELLPFKDGAFRLAIWRRTHSRTSRKPGGPKACFSWGRRKRKRPSSGRRSGRIRAPDVRTRGSSGARPW